MPPSENLRWIAPESSPTARRRKSFCVMRLHKLAVIVLFPLRAYWIVPVVVTEAGLVPAATVAVVIGVSAPLTPMVNWKTPALPVA